MTMSRLASLSVAILLAAVALALPGTARADELYTHAEVVCQKGQDLALVRFTTAWNADPPAFRRLPQSVDRGLSATPPSQRQDCTMANGWKIRVRSRDKQAFAYGMGGADPPAFFSLWIARHKVISRREWKPGYGNDTDPWLVAVVIRPHGFTVCRVAQSRDALPKGEVSCADEPLQLDRSKLDPIEYAPPGTRPPVGTMLLLPGSPSPRVCREYLRLRRDDWPDSYANVDSAKIFGPRAAYPDPPLSETIVEVAPSVRRKLINWSGDYHYFDGDLMFLAPLSSNPRAVLKWDMLRDPDGFPDKKLPAGWRLISGQQPGLYPDVDWRYVHFDTQKISGRLYLLAQPTSREDQPTAILVQPVATGFRSICRFQRVEANF